MDIAARIYAESILKVLVRGGVLQVADILKIADEQDVLAERNPREADMRREVAHLLRTAVLDVGPPPAVDPRVQYEADFRRRQMIERTAMIAKDQE